MLRNVVNDMVCECLLYLEQKSIMVLVVDRNGKGEIGLYAVIGESECDLI